MDYAWCIPSWKRHQHYRDRKPPWIKLHRAVLDDPDIILLAPRLQGAIMLLWVLASEDPEGAGRLPDLDTIRFRLRRSDLTASDMITLEKHGLIKHTKESASNALASRLQVARPEVETEVEREREEEKEKHIVGQARRWVEILNETSGKNFRLTDAHSRHIKARINEGFTVEDCIAVCRAKVREWKHTTNERFIRPETIFGTKFDGYLQNVKSAFPAAEKGGNGWINYYAEIAMEERSRANGQDTNVRTLGNHGGGLPFDMAEVGE